MATPHLRGTLRSPVDGAFARMQETTYDVIVVGAGFAGVACAHALARHGVRVCVIDRKRDLGERLHTTGILVAEALLHPCLAGLPAPFARAVPHARLYAPNHRSLLLAAPGYRFYTTDTPALMRWLGEGLVDHGIALRLGTPFRDAVRDGEHWRLPGIGRARWLVGADGATSRVAARLGVGQVNDWLYGVEHEFDGVALREPDALHCFVSKQYAPGYIGWVAQTPTGVQAGLARRHLPGSTTVPDIDGFLRHTAAMTGLPASPRPSSIRAGVIPCGGPIHPRQREGLMLAGDAAGMVSPVTAGGIHAGLRHGSAVGEAIAHRLHHPGDGDLRVAADAVPAFRTKRMLRWAFDRLQFDVPFDLAMRTPFMRRVAEQLYFHQRGHVVPGPGVGTPARHD